MQKNKGTDGEQSIRNLVNLFTEYNRENNTNIQLTTDPYCEFFVLSGHSSEDTQHIETIVKDAIDDKLGWYPELIQGEGGNQRISFRRVRK